MTGKRPKIPQVISDGITYRSHHTCNLCHDERKAVEIHHIDEKNDNNDLSNLILLCSDCHKIVQAKEFGRKYSKNELCMYRTDWELIVKEKFILKQEKILLLLIN